MRSESGSRIRDCGTLIGMTHLEELSRKALDRGWASDVSDLAQLLDDARRLGWSPVPIRAGEPAVSTLRVVDRANAHRNSLSAMVGTGAQPLHTDGAHLRRMPDIVVLSAAAPTTTPTMIYRPGVPTLAQRSGVFRVGGGRGAFYAGAVDSVGRWRYDPGCMTPTDAEAREAATQFRVMSDAAERHEWSRPGEVLVIANRRVLHARAAATDADSRRVHRVALRTGWDD